MEFDKAFNGLTESNKSALNEAIMDLGITTYDDLVKAINMAHTFICEATCRLTFEQFQRGKNACTQGKLWCEENGFEDESLEVLMYPEGSFIIVKSPGQYQLIVGYGEWRSNDLESLERILYDRWYC